MDPKKSNLVFRKVKKKEFYFVRIWKLFTIILFAYVFYLLTVLSTEVNYETKLDKNLTKSEIDIEFCYDLELNNNTLQTNSKS